MFKCGRTNAEAARNEGQHSDLTDGQLNALMGLRYARGILGTGGAITWGPSRVLKKHIPFIGAMPRQKFRGISRYLHFDDKNTRTERAETKQFTLMSELFQLFLQ